jgi:glycosyltransferase involved in cell wall biosynthesis
MPNVLFVLYHDFTANSAIHVHALSNHLIDLGYDCVVAVPNNKLSAKVLGQPRYGTIEFDEFPKLPDHFFNRKGPDLVHAWTPREIVRTFCAQLETHYRFRLIVHLEDNEEYLLEKALRTDIRQLRRMPASELDRVVLSSLSHPQKYVDMLKHSDGVTVVIGKLKEFVPEGVPICEIWPGAEIELFHAGVNDDGLRERLEIPKTHTVLGYAGNVHHANIVEMRSLYLAVGILNREGFPTTLVRAGVDYHPVFDEDIPSIKPYIRNLGYIEHKELPSFYALADLFVQPGRPDSFNDYRFPSKLPEFFAMGKPVILPKTNVGLVTKHREDAFVLSVADAINIVGAVKSIVTDRDLWRSLREGSCRFFQSHFRWSETSQKLSQFYDLVLGGGNRKSRVSPRRDSGSRVLPPNSRSLLDRYSNSFHVPEFSYGTVKDYCDSCDNLPALSSAQGDLKDQQRPWMVKAILGSLHLDFLRTQRLLEIGAGEPLVAQVLAELGYEVTVVDPYDGSGNGPTEFQKYVKAYPLVQIYRCRFSTITCDMLDAGSFDCIYSISVLEHLNPHELIDVYEAIQRFLRSGGYSIHCFDHVTEGQDSDFHAEQAKAILRHQKAIQGTGKAAFEEEYNCLMNKLGSDLETFYLAATGHNLWRGTRSYDEFPFRKVISLQHAVQKA